MIRQACIDDVDQTWELAKKFHVEIKRPYEESWKENIRKNMHELIPTSWVMEEDGKIIGMYISIIGEVLITGERFLQEFFWYTLPGHRGKSLQLFDVAERYAKENGLSMVLAHPVETEFLAPLYEKLGFKKYETVYKK